MKQEITTTKFHDIPVRIVTHEGTPMIPVVDIANALGYDRSNMTRLLKRNEELFELYKGRVKMTTPGGEQELICLSEGGVAGLLIKMDYARVKDKFFRLKVMAFQKWAIEVLTTAMKTEIETSFRDESRREIGILNYMLDFADVAIKRSGVPKEIAHGIAWAITSQHTIEDLNAYASYIRAQKDPEPLLLATSEEVGEYEKHYSLKKLSDFLKKSPDRIRNELEKLRVIYFQNGIWHLTALGGSYGKVFMVMPGYPYSNRMKAYIKYNNAAVELLRNSFETPSQSKLGEGGTGGGVN